MDERSARIAFNMIESVGSVTLAKWRAAAEGSAVAAYERLDPARRVDATGREPDWQREMARAERMGVTIVTEVDAAYPDWLRAIPSPPLALYVAGNPAALSKLGVAIVGSRRASSYGLDMAERFAFGLARAGWSIISGLALGIDAAAHRGALAAKGVTVGVLGGALDCFYPDKNKPLARQIVDSGGAVISEFPFGRRPDMQTFPQRNRIVSGLSRGVLAVEAPLKSGTLITCSLALEQGRTVMAIPGRIDSPVSAGTNKLIREGASAVTSVDDVLEDLSGVKDDLFKTKKPAAPAASARAEIPAAPHRVKLSIEEQAVLKALEGESISVDQLSRKAKMPVARINVLLIGLRLKRQIRFIPGGRVESIGH